MINTKCSIIVIMATNSLDITYNGYFVPRGGYGILNWQWAKHLARAGVNVYIKPFFSIDPYITELSSEERELLAKEPKKTPRVGIVETQPWGLDWVKNPVKLVTAMVESDAVGGKWVETLNQATVVIAPNDFCKRILTTHGVQRPIVVIRPGVDIEDFPYFNRPPRDVFTFGMCGYLDKRKGAIEVIQAFCSEFRDEKDVRLVLHSSNSDFGFYRSVHDPRVTITTKFKTREQLRDFYNMLDCFVFPSRGEGIGYPPREAMATGLPVIAMNWSGLEDIMSPAISYPIQPAGLSLRNDFVEQPGKWANIDVSELMYQMRNVYENRLDAKEKGKKAHQYIKEMFSWKRSAREMIYLIKKYETFQ